MVSERGNKKTRRRRENSEKIKTTERKMQRECKLQIERVCLYLVGGVKKKENIESITKLKLKVLFVFKIKSAEKTNKLLENQIL